MKAEVEHSFGPGASVRKMKSFSPVEVHDLNGETTKEEILEAVAGPGFQQGARVFSLRKMFGGDQMVILMLSNQTAKRKDFG